MPLRTLDTSGYPVKSSNLFIDMKTGIDWHIIDIAQTYRMDRGIGRKT